MSYELIREDNTIAIVFEDVSTTSFKNKNTGTYWELNNINNQLLIRKKDKASKTVFLHATIKKINITPTQTIADSTLDNIKITLQTILGETLIITGSDVLKFMYQHPFLSYININDNRLGWDFYDCINTILAYMYTEESEKLIELAGDLINTSEVTVLDTDGVEDGVINATIGDNIVLSAKVENANDNDKIEFYMED